MDELIKLLSTGSPTAIVLCAAALVLTIVVAVIYAVAFAQGRSVSFWPPSIGERPKSPTSVQNDGESPAFSVMVRNGTAQSPVVDRGTILQAASGKSYRVLSAIYGGANATIYKAEDPGGNSVIAKMY